MRTPIPGALKESLLHFLALGAALFALHAWTSAGDDADAARGEIVVSAGRVRSLAETFSRQWSRLPTDDELAGLIRDFVREEVLAREAIGLGLDRDDTIVRRRLAQKMEFLSDDVAAAAEPTDDELGAFLAAHPERFRVDARFTFDQILLDRRTRGDRLEADAAALLAALAAPGAAADPATWGDGRMLQPRFVNVTRREVEAQLGPRFADSLEKLPVGRFAWPVESGYGPHLVRIEQRTPARMPTLDEVRTDVAREWAAARRLDTREAQLQALLARYRVTVEPAPSREPERLTAASR